MASVLFTGIAKGHRANPTISIRVNNIYGTPVLLSGIAALVLTTKEIDIIDSHFQETIRQLLRLHRNTPRCVLFFLAGTLPGVALIHMRQLNLFGMISRLGSNSLLYQHAKNFLTSVVCFKGSWFHQIRKWCLLYNPSDLFERSLPKEQFKRMIKKK